MILELIMKDGDKKLRGKMKTYDKEVNTKKALEFLYETMKKDFKELAK